MTLRTAASLAALMAAMGMASPLSSQTPPAQRAPATQPAAPPAPVTGQILEQDPNTILAKQGLIGNTVYASDQSTIGSISDLILSKDGKAVEGFLIGVGGFLGIGEKVVALKMERLKMTPAPDGSLQLTMDASKEELTRAPSFKSKRDQDAERAAAQQRTQPPPAQRPSAPTVPK
jgi:hypothetical protein